MSVTSGIRRMIAAGLTLEQALTAAEIMEAEAPRLKDEQAERRRAKDRERKRLRNSAETAESTEPDDGVSRAQVVVLPVEEKKEERVSLPSEARPSDLDEAVEAYNSEAILAGWPRAERITTQRKSALKARLADCGGIEPWRRLMARARASPFLTGSNDRGWLPNIDFFLQAKSFTKLTEGAYDGNRTQRMASASTGRRSGTDALMAALAAESERPSDWGLDDSRASRADLSGGPILDLRPVGEVGRMATGRQHS